MDKTFSVYMAIGLATAYVIITNVRDIQKEDEMYRNNEYNQKHKYDNYYSTDSVGTTIIIINQETKKKQKEIWNNSPIKKEMIELFPMFDDMIILVKDRIVGNIKEEIITKITKIQDDFISGTISTEEAKRKLKEPL